MLTFRRTSTVHRLAVAVTVVLEQFEAGDRVRGRMKGGRVVFEVLV